MKTVLFEEIDGYNVVKGFDMALRDPVATKEILDKEIIKTEEFKSFKTITDKITEVMKLKFAVEKKLKGSHDEKERAKFFSEAALHTKAIESFQDDIKDLLPALNIARENILKDKAVFFEPKAGENIIWPDEFETLKEKIGAAMKKGRVLDIDGNEILDNRDKEVFKKIGGNWEHIRISKLGEKIPANAKSFEELTVKEQGEIQDYFEDVRVSKLAGTIKAREKTQILKRLPETAAAKRSQYEIEKKSDPLALSQKWLADETAIIEKRYG